MFLNDYRIFHQEKVLMYPFKMLHLNGVTELNQINLEQNMEEEQKEAVEEVAEVVEVAEEEAEEVEEEEEVDKEENLLLKNIMNQLLAM